MALYSKSISEIVSAKLNKGKKREEDEPVVNTAKEEKRLAKEAVRINCKLTCLAGKGGKESCKGRSKGSGKGGKTIGKGSCKE